MTIRPLRRSSSFRSASPSPRGPWPTGVTPSRFRAPPNGPIVQSTDGKDLVASGPIKFTLADVTAPTIINTTANGRIVTINFSKALDPSTVTLSDIFVVRQGTVPTWPPTQADVGEYTNLNSDPRATISYSVVTNPTTGALSYVVTLDYSALPQTEMPSDKYAIVALSTPGASGGVTDLVGNPLNGSFSGSFPSGSTGTPLDFIQNLGQQNVVAPTITTFVLNPTAANDTGIVGDQNTNDQSAGFDRSALRRISRVPWPISRSTSSSVGCITASSRWLPVSADEASPAPPIFRSRPIRWAPSR